MRRILFFLVVVCSVLLPFISLDAETVQPKTPKEKWYRVRTDVIDSVTLKPVAVKYRLISEKDSTEILTGESEYERWLSYDGEQEVEKINLILPDHDERYLLEVKGKNYVPKIILLDFTHLNFDEIPLDKRWSRIDNILLTKQSKKK
ncbi:MAG: hypothetical protein K2J23_00575 [Muribaculaceae bacterium]|nr:hypothetical protein [Muribaculaceae bacterium]MDE6836286.1 hypothetical protein [Muribaculaceae bacterium]MDE6865876.1 hypothetical protein [Muribaculaceae bacterium]